MSSTFRLVEVLYFLDGNQIFSASAEIDEIHRVDEDTVFEGSVLPGPHNISVSMCSKETASGSSRT